MGPSTTTFWPQLILLFCAVQWPHGETTHLGVAPVPAVQRFDRGRRTSVGVDVPRPWAQWITLLFAMASVDHPCEKKPPCLCVDWMVVVGWHMLAWLVWWYKWDLVNGSTGSVFWSGFGRVPSFMDKHQPKMLRGAQ